MDCRQVQDWLFDADDPRPERCDVPEVAKHLATCAACQARAVELVRLQESWRSIPLPASADEARLAFLEQLPPPTQPFRGKIERIAAQSTPYWPMRVVPPTGAPNVLLIMTDDTGFGVSSTFGGVIPTPNLDRIAANGLRYTNFNSTALCSPSRAAHHRPQPRFDGLRSRQ